MTLGAGDLLQLCGLEKHPGFKLTLPLLHALLYAVLYGDLLMALMQSGAAL